MEPAPGCPATHVSPTAGGDITVRCELGAGHQPADEHEAWLGPFPVYWTGQVQSPPGSTGNGA